MIKLAVILPGDYGKEMCEYRKKYFKDLASKSTEIAVFETGGTGYPSVANGIDFAFIAPGAVKISQKAEKNNFDGILIHGMCDFGIEACRSAVSIPVVGLAASTYHVACQLADRFGAVSPNAKTIPELKRRIRLIGCYDRLTSLRPLNIPIPEMMNRKSELKQKFLEITKYQIDKEGAELIVVGSGSILPALGIGAKTKIQKELGVPVLEPAGIAIRTLEMFANLGITHSKRTYPLPN